MIIFHLFHANLSRVPLRALGNPPLFYSIRAAQCFFHLTKSDEVTQADELRICTFASTTMREQFESRNETQTHHAAQHTHLGSLFYNSNY